MRGSQRRARGEGHYKSLPSGKWQIRLRIDGQEVTASGDTKTEAKANLEKRLAKPVGQELFLNLAQRYLNSREEWGATTSDGFQNWLSSKVEGHEIAKMKGCDDKMVAEWKSGLTGSTRTKANSFRHLKAVLAFGGLQTTVKAPKIDPPTRRPLTPEEVLQFEDIAKAAGPKVHLAFLLAVDAGLRRSEICGLAYDAIDGNGAYIKRAVVYTKGQNVVKKTKNKKVVWVPFTEQIMEAIGAGSGFVLGEGREPLSPKTLASWFYDLKKGSKVPFMGLHALRRTFGMSLLEEGTDVKTAAEMMRHDPNVLLKVYAASRRDLMEAASKKIGGRRRVTNNEKDNGTD